jgi:hypothetical protein
MVRSRATIEMDNDWKLVHQIFYPDPCQDTIVNEQHLWKNV